MPESTDHNTAAIPDADSAGVSRAPVLDKIQATEQHALLLAELASIAQSLAMGKWVGVSDVRAIGRLLIASRMASGMNKAEAARKLGLQAPAMSRYEKQEFETLSIKRLSAMASKLGLEIEINVRLGETPVTADDSQAAPSGRPETTRSTEGGHDHT